MVISLSDKKESKIDQLKVSNDWSFEQCYLLLNDPTLSQYFSTDELNHDPKDSNNINHRYLIECLNKFIDSNTEILTNFKDGNLPFTSSKDTTNIIKDNKFNLRNLNYSISGLNDTDKKLCSKLSKLLNFDLNEVYRIIIGVSNRIPFALNNDDIDNTTLNDSSDSKFTKLSLFTSSILKERRIVLKLLLKIMRTSDSINNGSINSKIKNNDKLSSISKLSNNIISNANEIVSSLIKSLKSCIEFMERLQNDINSNFESSLLIPLTSSSSSTSLSLTTTSNSSKDTPLPNIILNLIISEYSTFLLDILHLLSYLILKNPNHLDTSLISNWFDLMVSLNFCSKLSRFFPDSKTKLHTIESLSSLISILVLNLDDNLLDFSDYDTTILNSRSLTNDGKTLRLITDDLLSLSNPNSTNLSVTNSMVFYAWSILLHRKHVLLSDLDPSNPVCTKFLQDFDGDLNDLRNLYELCALTASNFGIVPSLKICHDVLSYDEIYTAISGSFVINFIPYVVMNDNIAKALNEILTDCPTSILKRYFENPATDEILTVVRAKLPISLKTFIRLVSINSNLAVEEFKEFQSYMEILKEDEFYFKYKIDDEIPELIKLVEDLDISPPYESNNELSLLLKKGTKGQIIGSTGISDENETIISNTNIVTNKADETNMDISNIRNNTVNFSTSRPQFNKNTSASSLSSIKKSNDSLGNNFASLKKGATNENKIDPTKSKDLSDSQLIVVFLYKYNGWALLGRILKNLSKSFDAKDGDKMELAVEIIRLLNTIVSNIDIETVSEIFKVMSIYVEDYTDVLEVIFRILEQSTHARSTDMIKECLDFLSSLSGTKLSFRVWSYLYQSSLIGFKVDSSTSVNTILGSVEIVDGNFDFTISLLKLTDNLINNSLTLEETVSSKLMSEVLDKLTSQIIHIFENFLHWRFVNDYERYQIGSYSVNIFNKFLIYLYGIDSSNLPENKVTKVFKASVDRITATFLIPDVNDCRSTKPIIYLIEKLSSPAINVINQCGFYTNDLTGYWYEKWCSIAFEFASTLISIRPHYQATIPSVFEMKLFSLTPNLVQIYSNNFNMSRPILRLLTCLINGSWESEPPSLLTHLGRHHTDMLLSSMSTDLSNYLVSYDVKIALYDFFASTMQKNQEGLSIRFITGKDIKEWILEDKLKYKTNKLLKSTTEQNSTEINRFSLLKILKQNISLIPYYPNSVNLHLVDAIALAFNSWTTAKEEDNDQEFIEKLVSQMLNFPVLPASNSNYDDDMDVYKYIDYCYELNLISKIAEILSFYLFVSQNKKCTEMIFNVLRSKEFVESLTSKFRIFGYNYSLHRNLETKFKERFQSLSLSNFKRAPYFRKNRYGTNATYRLPLMDTLFESCMDDWPAIREEVVVASVNLQFVSAQISTAKSLGALITSYCKTSEGPIDTKYIQLSAELLTINDEEGIQDSMFEDIFHERIELAFLICFSFSKTSKSKINDKLLFSLFSSVSQLLSSTSISFTSKLLVRDETMYYRPLLRIVLLCLKAIKDDSLLLVEYSATFVDLFDYVISIPIRIIFSSIHNEVISNPNQEFDSSSLIAKQIDDISLILTISKEFLRLKFPNDIGKMISNSLSNNGTLKVIINIYTCSHLIKYNNEKIFAEMSLLFIYEFVSVKAIAEELIISGLFPALIESPTSILIRKGGIVPIPSNLKLHNLWSNGLLSIVLTLIGNFGEKILPEVCLFVTSFQRQFLTTIHYWLESNTPISTASIQETGQIILLAKTLHSMGGYDYMLRTNPSVESITLIPGLDTKGERLAFLQALNYLISHPRYLSLRVIPISIEQQNLLESDQKSNFTDNLLEEIKQLKQLLLD